MGTVSLLDVHQRLQWSMAAGDHDCNTFSAEGYAYIFAAFLLF